MPLRLTGKNCQLISIIFPPILKHTSHMFYRMLFQLFDRCVDILIRNIKELRVCNGPFKGMPYVHGAVGSSLIPKILGTYELEIAQWISGFSQFQLGLDVGAAEGYYAVGILRQGICDRVIAWETNLEGRTLLGRLAGVNHVQSRLDIRGHCDAEQLKDAITAAEGDVLVIVDCEGFEGDLLEPLEEILLGRCTFVIETHNPMNPGIHERLRKKLESTHTIQESFPRRRLATDLPIQLPGWLKLLRFPILRRLAMSERRCPNLGWLLCRPKGC